MMPSYPVQCPYCKTVVDSNDSVADSIAEYQAHLRVKHPEKVAKK